VHGPLHLLQDVLSAGEVAEALVAMRTLRRELIALQAGTTAMHKAPGIAPPEQGAAKVLAKGHAISLQLSFDRLSEL
jgi:hypothetical protein